MPSEAGNGGPVTISDGPFAGWLTWSSGADAYETMLGPFCFKITAGKVICAFDPRGDHLNNSRAIHGGALMSFADFALFAIAHNALRGTRAVTLTLNCEFLSAGKVDDRVEASGEILRETRTLIFARGLVTQNGQPVLAFSGTLKKIG